MLQRPNLAHPPRCGIRKRCRNRLALRATTVARTEVALYGGVEHQPEGWP